MIVVEKVTQYEGWTIEQSQWVRSGLEPASRKRHYFAYRGEEHTAAHDYTSLAELKAELRRRNNTREGTS